MEYGSIIWDPFTQVNIRKLEMVQRRYAHFVCMNDHYRKSSATAMLDQLQWPSLEERGAQVMFCIKNSVISIPLAALTSSLPASQRGHDQKLQVPYARTQVLQKSFFPDATVQALKLITPCRTPSPVPLYQALTLIRPGYLKSYYGRGGGGGGHYGPPLRSRP